MTVVEECDYAALQAVRGERSLPALVLRAVAAALREYPELNATLDGQEIVYWDRLDLGLAVQTERGLLVPVVTGVHERSWQSSTPSWPGSPRARVQARWRPRSCAARPSRSPAPASSAACSPPPS